MQITRDCIWTGYVISPILSKIMQELLQNIVHFCEISFMAKIQMKREDTCASNNQHARNAAIGLRFAQFHGKYV